MNSKKKEESYSISSVKFLFDSLNATFEEQELHLIVYEVTLCNCQSLDLSCLIYMLLLFSPSPHVKDKDQTENTNAPQFHGSQEQAGNSKQSLERFSRYTLENPGVEAPINISLIYSTLTKWMLLDIFLYIVTL